MQEATSTDHWLSGCREFHRDVLQVFQDGLVMLLKEGGPEADYVMIW